MDPYQGALGVAGWNGDNIGERKMPHTPKADQAGDLDTATKMQALLDLYKEQCSHGRHTESQRHLVTAMVLTAAGALLAVVSSNGFQPWAWPLAACVALLGLLGLGFARVYEIKWDEAGRRRNYYREQLQDLAGIASMPKDYVPRNLPEKQKPRKHRFSRLRDYWRITFLFVTFAGLIAIWLCLDGDRDNLRVPDVKEPARNALQ